MQVTQCTADGGCVGLPPWELNVPQFIKVDFENSRLATTAARGQNRNTPIKNLARSEGLIFLQGIEDGRVFSFVIAEETGMASIALATDGLAVTVFGAVAARRRTRRAKSEPPQEIEQQSLFQQQATAEQIENFKKAFGVCLEAKDYLVKL